MNYLFPPPPVVSVPVLGLRTRFAVRRVYCVARNYEEHAREMGSAEREPPFFFLKPADAIVAVEEAQTGTLAYPSLTHNLHHEVELVVAIGRGGKNILANHAAQHVYGYGVGLDMTRRDLQNEMKKQGRPWCISKAFDQSAPIGPITPAAQAGDIEHAMLSLRLAGQERQRGCVDHMIWSVPEVIAQLSMAWELAAGDLIFTGTPAGVASVLAGDTMVCTIDGLSPLTVRIT